MAKAALSEITGKLYALLEKLESDDRQKVVRAVFELLGEPTPIQHGVGRGRESGDESGDAHDWPIGVKAQRWMRQHAVSTAQLEEVFHFDNGTAEIIATDVPGESKREKTRRCYLLVGLQALISTDNAKFSDVKAVALCVHMRCYDQPNNSAIRNSIQLGGNKKDGFTLTAPCLTAAAELIKEIAPGK